MRTREQIRKEEREYEGDVVYDVWRRGGNPDRIDVERVQEHYYQGDEHEMAARDELRHQQRRGDK